MAAPQKAKDRKVLQPIADFDFSKLSAFPPSFHRSVQSLALSVISPTQTLIYVGTEGGKIVLLSANPTASCQDSDSKSIEFLRSASVCESPVLSVVVLPEIGRVLAVSDGFLYLIDTQLSQPARKLGYPTGVLTVAKRLCGGDGGSDSEGWSRLANGTHRITGQKFLQKLSGGIKGAAAAAKSRASNSGGDGNSVVVAVAVAKKLILMALLVAGTDSDAVESVALKEIQGSEGVKAMAWLDDSIIIGTEDGYIMISCSSGQSTSLFLLPESSSRPCLKTLWRHREAILSVDNVAIVVNPLGQPVGGSLVFRHAPDCIGEIGSKLVAVRNGTLDVYHKKMGTCVQSISFDGPRVGLTILADEESGSGELLVVATASKVLCFKKVPSEEQIKDLLRKKSNKEAIQLVEELESEGELTKEMLSFVHAQVGFLLLFDLHFEEAVNHFLLSEDMQPSEIFPFIMRDPNRWSPVVPRNRYWGLHPPPVLIEEVVDNGLVAIQRALFLRKAGVDTGADEDYLLNPPSRADLLESAIQNLIRYLAFSRKKAMDPSVKEGVDTLLMYLYRALNQEDEMELLASSSNSCVVEELETLLQDSGHLRTLAFLYANKGMSSKALDVWRILSRTYSFGLWKDLSDSQAGSKDVMFSQRTAAREASALLEVSSNEELVLQHLGWIADLDQELAVRILTSDKRANQLSPEQVLAAIDPKKVEIQQRYLQWLIDDQDSDDCQFHTIYAVSLAKSALEAIEMEPASHLPSDKLVEGRISDSESGNISRLPVRERLQLFLQSSDLYDPEEVLYLIERSELWLEKSILYRKLGQETLVLQILALKLEDCEAAEQYCAQIGRQDAYMQLLDMYLDPQNGKEPMFRAAVRLLHKHGECLDPLQVLESLSADMPLQLASDTITRILKARNHHHRQGQIVYNLSRAVNLEAKLIKLEERSRHVQINDESLCDSCHARLGTKLFAMYPDDSVVCYKCFRRRGESAYIKGGPNMKPDAKIFKPGWLVNKQS